MPPSMSNADIRFNFKHAGVLLVDQSPSYMDVMAEILLAFGFNKLHRRPSPDGFHDDREATAPDLILIDPYPDQQKAMGFIQEARRREADGAATMLVIVVTGKPSREVVTTAQRSGADYVVAKPFSPKVLLDRILWSASVEPAPTYDVVAGRPPAVHRSFQRS
jgi:DNA-binding response OmpR family regulator